jgi:predicted glycoside hydrolase/deacetylase ChbG (UPF0249 family)
MTDTIRLTVMADDYGMHPAVNEGIVDSFVNGLLTDANVMTPCDGFEDAVKLAKQHGLPVGLHSTFSCDFDRFRWGPVTDMKTLVDGSGYFVRDTDRWDGADVDEARREQDAQFKMLADTGLPVTHISEHMGVDDGGKFFTIQSELADRTGIPHRLVCNPLFKDRAILQYTFDDHVRVSSVGPDFETRKGRLREKLFALKPGGTYIWIVHPAADLDVLDTFQTPDTDMCVWARRNRVLDLKLLLDAEVKEWMEQLDVELTPVSDVPFAKAPRKF